MLRNGIVGAAVAWGLLFGVATTAGAMVVDFEGSTVTGAARNLDMDGANLHGPSLIDYAGYNWVGFSVSKPGVSVNRPRQITGFVNDPEDGPTPLTTPVDTGFHRSAVSGDTVSFLRNTGGTSLFGSVSSLSGADNFNFLSTYATSAYRDNVTATIVGLRDGVTIYEEIFTLGVAGPMLLQLDFINIDEIRFLSSGGDFLYANGTGIGDFVNPGNAFSSPILAFDDMFITAFAATAVMEPAMTGILGLGLVAMGGMMGRRRRLV